MIPLFEAYQALQGKLPHVALCDLPTPVEKLEAAGKALNTTLYIKRDDICGQLYGGNKPRRLEFLLARAQAWGVKEVLTFGYAGSNHALATALYARRLGLGSILMLLEQPNANYVRKNLAASHSAGAELHHYPNVKGASVGTILQMVRHTLTRGRFPYAITAGGSSPRGTIGYVNAALELKRQIDAGLLPEPQRIYVPFGSMGTAVGLVLGLKVAGLRSQVVGIDVVGERWASASKAVSLYDRTNALLNSLTPSFPRLPLLDGDLVLKAGFLGDGYAHFTKAGMEAVEFLSRRENTQLDGTYSGKTFAALMADAQAGELTESRVLFWNTYNSRPLPGLPGGDYRVLPPAFHRYFERDVQALEAVSPVP
jgi:1-aminocyclopropane-1-carboxylate deaminase/D-cysteine desulfhydrase-like pyridoxal-dependent ACC family enzyme